MHQIMGVQAKNLKATQLFLDLSKAFDKKEKRWSKYYLHIVSPPKENCNRYDDVL